MFELLKTILLVCIEAVLLGIVAAIGLMVLGFIYSGIIAIKEKIKCAR